MPIMTMLNHGTMAFSQCPCQDVYFVNRYETYAHPITSSSLLASASLGSFLGCTTTFTTELQGSDSTNCCRNTGERIEVLALPLDESRGFTEDPSYPKSAGLLFGLMWLRAYIAAKKQPPAKHAV